LKGRESMPPRGDLAGAHVTQQEGPVTPTFVLPPTPGAIFFDAVGTLIHPDPSAPAVYAEIGQRHGSRLNLETIAQRFRDAFGRQDDIDRLAAWRTDEERERRRWRAIVAETLTDVADTDACFRELFGHFARPDAWGLNPVAGPTLRALADTGWRIGLASNFDGRLRGVAAGLQELRPVSLIVVSSEVGWRKPSQKFFRALQEAAAEDPAKIVLVGDDPINDYDAARSAGLAAVLYDPRDARRDGAVQRIRRLSDLLPVRT
jgi:putative hydrolase of the HAD superfamily